MIAVSKVYEKLEQCFRPQECTDVFPIIGEQCHNTDQIGRVFTFIVRGNPADIKARMAAYQPLLLEALPLSLEEIFIYELGGEDYAVRDIVL